MAQAKTAISLDQSVYKQMDKLARSLRISRSRAFELAAKQFLRSHKDADITQRLNQVYGEDEFSEEEEIASRMKPRLRKVVDKEAW